MPLVECRKWDKLDEETQRVLTELAAFLEGTPEVEAAFLFGSRAEGSARPDSDYDVAVALQHGVRRQRTCAVRDDLWAKVSDLTHRDTDDVVVLDDASALLAFHCVAPQCPFYEGRSGAWLGVALRCLDQWYDFEPHWRAYTEAVMQAALRGKLGARRRQRAGTVGLA